MRRFVFVLLALSALPAFGQSQGWQSDQVAQDDSTSTAYRLLFPMGNPWSAFPGATAPIQIINNSFAVYDAIYSTGSSSPRFYNDGSGDIGVVARAGAVFLAAGGLTSFTLNTDRSSQVVGSLQGPAVTSTSQAEPFVYIGSSQGTPTGTPVRYLNGGVAGNFLTPIVIDVTNKIPYWYSFTAGAWIAFGAGAGITALTHDVTATGPGSAVAEVTGITDVGSVDWQVTGAFSNGKVLGFVGGGLQAVSYQAPLTACTDYVSLTCVTGATDLGGTNATPTVIGVENSALVRGNVRVTNTSIPSTPSAGTNICWADSTAKNIACRNDTGAVNHGVQSNGGAANKWISAIADNGTETLSQPAFTDISGSLSCSQTPAYTGDVTKASGSCTTVLANIPNDTPAAGDILFTSIAAPGPPGAGARVWYDSTAANLFAEDSGANINHGIQTVSCPGSQWISQTFDSGNASCTQPAFTDVSGSVACGQLPAFTGDVTKASGSCATVDTNKGKIYVDATDAAAHSPDYLYPKLTSFTNTISFSPIGTGDGQLTVDVVPLPTTIMTYFMNIPLTVLSTGWIATNDPTNFYTAQIEYSASFVVAHVELTANLITNGIPVGPAVTIGVTRNGSNIIGAVVNFNNASSTGVQTNGPIATGSASAADTYGITWGSGPASGNITVSFTLKLDAR